jgi:hypothetical protein
MAKPQPKEIEPVTVALWPTTGRALGLGKNLTYECAKTGEIPTVRFGRSLKVPMWFFKKLRDGSKSEGA